MLFQKWSDMEFIESSSGDELYLKGKSGRVALIATRSDEAAAKDMLLAKLYAIAAAIAFLVYRLWHYGLSPLCYFKLDCAHVFFIECLWAIIVGAVAAMLFLLVITLIHLARHDVWRKIREMDSEEAQ